MACLECARGFHWECGEPCCCADSTEENPLLSEVLSGESKRPVGRPPKADSEVTVSAGRKRAATQFKDEMGEDYLCEWLGYANCGGGLAPVIGCLHGRRTDIHHGPDKTTTNNAEDNISLICSLCHNRWHAANDPLYGIEKYPVGARPKNPRPQTKEEFLQAIANETNRKE